MALKWNTKHEDLVQKRLRYCKYRTESHLLTSQVLQKRSKWLAIPALICQIIVATSIWSEVEEDTTSTWRTVITGTIAIVSSILSGIRDYYRLEKRSLRHYHSSQQYERLARDVEEQLSFLPNNREPIRSFFRHISRQLHDIEMDAEPIPAEIADSYLKNVKQDLDQSINYHHHSLKRQKRVKDVKIPMEEDKKESKDNTPPKSPTFPLQDAFAEKVDRSLQEKKARLEKYQLDRLNE